MISIKVKANTKKYFKYKNHITYNSRDYFAEFL